MDPRCMFGRIYRVIYIATHNIKHLGLVVSEKEIFFMFSHF